MPQFRREARAIHYDPTEDGANVGFTVLDRLRRGFEWPALQPVVKCGEEWLAVFCAILASIAGISVVTGVAYYVSWSKRQDYKPALSTRY